MIMLKISNISLVKSSVEKFGTSPSLSLSLLKFCGRTDKLNISVFKSYQRLHFPHLNLSSMPFSTNISGSYGWGAGGILKTSTIICQFTSSRCYCHCTFSHALFQCYSASNKACIIIQKRYKNSKKSQKRPEHDSDSDTDDEEPIMGSKVLSVRLQSLRMDGILKKGLNFARNKAETAFYEGNIRINGKKPVKKSQQVKIGDEVDLIRGVSPVNPDLLNISRIEILAVKEDDDEDDQLSIKIRRTKTLYIENYDVDPWKKGSTE